MSDSGAASQHEGPGPWVWIGIGLTILGIAGYLRFSGIGEPSMWFDEVLHLEKTTAAWHEPWQAWLTGLSVDRENGSLYYATQLLGLQFTDGETAVRLMPALAGLLAVALALAVGLAATGNWRIAAASAALLAVSPLSVYYSREGRPYAAVMLIVSLLLWLALQRPRRWVRVATYLLCISTAYWGAVAAPVLVAVAVLATLEWLRSRRSADLALAAIAGLILGLAMFPTARRLGITSPPFAVKTPPPVEVEVTEPLSAIGLNRLLASLSISGSDWGVADSHSLIYLGLAIWGMVCLARRTQRRAYWVSGMFLLPVAGWLALLVALGRWYNVRYTSAGLPAFLLLVAIGLVDLTDRLARLLTTATRRGDRQRISALLLVGLLVGLLTPAWRAARSEPLQKPDWRGVAELIDTLSSEDEPVITDGAWSEKCIGHYLRERQSSLAVLSAHSGLAAAQKLTRVHPRAWVLAAGYFQAADYRAWMRTLDAVASSRLSNLELVYHPDFSAFLLAPTRASRLAAFLARWPESRRRQEFEQSELLLGSGWSFAETGQDGATFRWATGETAEMGLLPREVDGDRVLRLRLYPFPNPDRPPQTVDISLNSRSVGRLELTSGWREYEIRAARELWDPAANLVTFQFGWRQSPSERDPSSPDTRHLAVAFDYVEAINVPDEVVSRASG